MKKYIVIIIILFSAFQINAQEKSSVKNNLFKINLITPGVTDELKLANKLTLNSDLNLAFTFFQESNGLSVKFFPFIREQVRYYYNLEKRLEKGKNIANNSGNFVALSSSYYFESLGEYNYIHALDGLTVAPVWGFQRTYKSNLNITVNAGLGYNFNSDPEIAGPKPVVNFTLGWVLGKSN